MRNLLDIDFMGMNGAAQEKISENKRREMAQEQYSSDIWVRQSEWEKMDQERLLEQKEMGDEAHAPPSHPPL